MKISLDQEEYIYEGVKNNDDKCIDLLCKTYFQSTTICIINEGGTKEDRLDIFQEAIMLFIQHVQSNKYDYYSGQMGGYIRTLVYGFWRNQQRRRKTIRLTEAHLAKMYYEGEDEIMNDLEREENKALCTKYVQLLSDKCKSIIMDRYRNILTDKEIAKKWIYSNANSLKQARRDCIKKLRKQILGKSGFSERKN